MFTYFVLKGVYILTILPMCLFYLLLLKEDVPKKINKPIFVVQPTEPTNSLCFQTNAITKVLRL